MQISLSDIRFHAYHGVLPQERQIGGDYSLTLRLQLDADPAATERDELSGTVDYAAVYDVVREEMQIPSQLLEHVCGRIARRVLRDFERVQTVSVSLTKLTPPIPGMTSAGATVELSLTQEIENSSPSEASKARAEN